jgi:hypothetical protein
MSIVVPAGYVHGFRNGLAESVALSSDPQSWVSHAEGHRTTSLETMEYKHTTWLTKTMRLRVSQISGSRTGLEKFCSQNELATTGLSTVLIDWTNSDQKGPR